MTTNEYGKCISKGCTEWAMEDSPYCYVHKYLHEEEEKDESLHRIGRILLQVGGMLKHAHIRLGPVFDIELSHHHGIERYREFGACIITIVNRAYCKKYIVMLPRQKHPTHMHQKKEETFILVDGDLSLEVDGIRANLKPGDQRVVKPGQWHKFSSLHGAVVEEISTEETGDSVYIDESINRLLRNERKTYV